LDQGFGHICNWFYQFRYQLVGSVYFPLGINESGNAFTYLTYGIFAVFGFLLFLKILPETKGKTLEQIETELVQ
jgi:hypothetical protein